METTEMSRAALLDEVQANRAAHESTYLEAMKGYRKQRAKLIEKLAAQAAKDPETSADKLWRLERPVSYLGEYDRVVAKLVRETRDTVELSDQEFRCYVLDEWTWSRGFAANTEMYLAR